MKKLLLFLCCLPIIASAQNFSFSARLGLASYQGDLKPTFNPFSQIKFLKSIGAQYDFSERLTARLYGNFTKLYGDDKKGTPAMQQRNLNFQTNLTNFELSAQYSIFSLNDKWWTPYIFAGVGVSLINPYTTDKAGAKVYLQPLSTEGQGFQPGINPYKLTQFSIPMGIGASYALNEDIRVGLETGYHKFFTDYLDDVSGTYVDASTLGDVRGQKAVELAYRGNEVSGGNTYPPAGTARGNAQSKDGYYYIAVTFTVRYWFDQYKKMAGLPASYKDKRVGCPSTSGGF